MKLSSILLPTMLLLLSVFSTMAQTDKNSPTFLNAQGMIKGAVSFYESEGYSITEQNLPGSLDEKGINKLKKKLSIPKDANAVEDPELPNIKCFAITKSENNATAHAVYYLTSDDRGNIKVITFGTFCDRDPSIEKEFLKAILNHSVPYSVYIPEEMDSIRFADRYIALGSACRWMQIHNVQCPGLGQMNWSEFSSFDRAKQMIASQKQINEGQAISKVLEEKEVDIVFEGKETKAIKSTLKFKIPKVVMGGSNVLHVYYVASEVRGKYVAAVLSYYEDQAVNGGLPPLLKEVMTLK